MHYLHRMGLNSDTHTIPTIQKKRCKKYGIKETASIPGPNLEYQDSNARLDPGMHVASFIPYFSRCFFNIFGRIRFSSQQMLRVLLRCIYVFQYLPQGKNADATELLGILKKYFSKNNKKYFCLKKKKRNVLLNKKSFFYFSHDFQT